MFSVKSVLVLLFILVEPSLTQDFAQDIICPVPGNPSPESVTEEDCNAYTACEYTGGLCHMLSSDSAGYIISSETILTSRGFYVTLLKVDPSSTMFGADVSQLILEVINHEDYHVQIKIYDAENPRYEVPLPLNLPNEVGASPMYSIALNVDGLPLAMNVTRNSNGAEIFSLVGPLTFEDQFIQVTFRLPSTYFYGLGESSRTSFRHSFEPRETLPLFARNQVVGPKNVNEYGVHPYFVNVEDEEGNTHSVLLYNSNAMEFSKFLLGENIPAVTIRTIGGILDFHIFMGPTPEDVNVQYANTVGLPAFPPYWAFGFHLSRWGYDSTDNYRIVHDRMKAAGIPWDTQVFDIDYMYRHRDFTYDPETFGDFPELIQQLHDENMRVILIQDPAVVTDWGTYPPGERGRRQDVFIKWSSPDLVPEDQPAGAADYIVGHVWPDNRTVFPDFLNPKTVDWWTNELHLFRDELPYDGIWIDMNEPANYYTNTVGLICPNNSLDNPPYGTLATFSPENQIEKISDNTICMSSVQSNGLQNFSHYDVHSLYGISHSIASYRAWSEDIAVGERPLILSRSTFVGSGKYAIHWLGDNRATWKQLRMSIIGMLEFNLFAIPMVGADVCGFSGESNEELCIRWMQLGAFYPFDRNHNSQANEDQDPARPGWDLAPTVSRDVLLLRYKYIPYMYARFYRAHMNGNSVIRPLFNTFPTDLMARDIDDQFMWSSELLVAPILYEGAVSRDVYFPEGLWYDLDTGTLESIGQETRFVNATIEKIPVFVRGGSILPYQEPSVTTVESRMNPFGLTVALNADRSAAGEVFWDDGVGEHLVSETFLGIVTFEQNLLLLTTQNDLTAADGLTLETIQFYGFPSDPTEIQVNGAQADQSSWSFDQNTYILVLSLSVPLNSPLDILLNYPQL